MAVTSTSVIQMPVEKAVSLVLSPQTVEDQEMGLKALLVQKKQTKNQFLRISTNVISFICQVIEEDERNKAAQTLLTDESITRTLWERLFQAQASILRGDKDCPVGKGSDPVCKWLYAMVVCFF